MFSGFMTNTWAAATIVALVAGVVGFFTVMRGAAFVAHAVPNGAFAGGAAASLLGLNPILGLGVFALLGSLGISWLGRRGRHDVVTALALVMMLGLGALFLSMSQEYASQTFSLLFGEVVGVSSAELLPILALGVVCVAAVMWFFRPLTLSSVMPEVAEARGVRASRMEASFLVILALATTMTVPVVGAFLMFSLTVAPAAAARSLTARPMAALGLSIGIAMVIVWCAIALSYLCNWPIGFFVGVLGAGAYGLARSWALYRLRRAVPHRLSPLPSLSAH
ncbi:MAG TPA: metal ABC transporter permease [Candidatus Saccharimonadales bacterium]|nr:metal ABC transporter permease [Candidatus Saccharimonadales bacterium]